MGSIDKYSEIFECVLKHVKPWQKYISSIDQVEIKKLNGLSNACYQVSIKEFTL